MSSCVIDKKWSYGAVTGLHGRHIQVWPQAISVDSLQQFHRSLFHSRLNRFPFNSQMPLILSFLGPIVLERLPTHPRFAVYPE